jgi:ketosteroid isomerase-like protein
MSAENVEIVRHCMAAYLREDAEALREHVHPNAELHEWRTAPDPQTYYGPEGLVRARKHWLRTWDWLEAEPREFTDAGDCVLVVIHNRAKGRGSGVEVEVESFNVFTVEDSKVTRVELFTDEQAALRAAGLRWREGERSGRFDRIETTREETR